MMKQQSIFIEALLWVTQCSKSGVHYLLQPHNFRKCPIVDKDPEKLGRGRAGA